MEAGPIRDLFANVPWLLLAAAFVGGFYVARSFPGLLPGLFKPRVSGDDVLARLDEIEKRLAK